MTQSYHIGTLAQVSPGPQRGRCAIVLRGRRQEGFTIDRSKRSRFRPARNRLWAVLPSVLLGNAAGAQEVLTEQALFGEPGTSLVRSSRMSEPFLSLPEEQREANERLTEFVERTGSPPNVLVILVDDMGWGDAGVYGGGEMIGASTPNIDALAMSRLRLASAYAQPTCSPTRATLLTGRLPIRHRVFGPPQVGESIGGGLTAEITLGQLLRDRGYHTAMMGKWHLGEDERQQPQYNGFDEYYGFYGSIKNYAQWRDEHIAPFYVNDPQIIEYVEQLDGFVGASAARGRYQDAVVEADYIVGRLIETLEATGQRDETLVIFASDNGPREDTWPDTGFTPFRGAKGSTWEGGVRVPGLISWPGMIAAGRVSDGLFDLADVFSTVLAAAGAEPPADRYIDGIN